jgi:drug/metabolite transporter (DMT)-like permease
MMQFAEGRNPRLSRTQTGTLQMLAGTVLISFSAVFVRLADVGPTTAGFYRMLFGSVLLAAIVLIKRQALWRGWTPLGLVFVAALFFTADLISWHHSIHYVGPGLATILANFQVFTLAIIGVLVFKERVTWRFVVAIPLALAGLFLLVGLDWSILSPEYRAGVWLGLVCAVMYTGYLLTLRKSQQIKARLEPTANLALISVVTAIFIAPATIMQGEGFGIPDGKTAVVLVAYGFLCQAIGWIIISWAVVKIDASRVGLLLLLQPTLTFIWDIVFFKRPTTSIELAGATLTLVAIYFGSIRRR